MSRVKSIISLISVQITISILHYGSLKEHIQSLTQRIHVFLTYHILPSFYYKRADFSL